MQASHPLLRAQLALLPLLLSCGGSGDLVVRQSAAHEALRAAGLQPLGDVIGGHVSSRAERRIERRFERAGCYLVNALLDVGAEGLTLRAVTEEGEEMSVARGARDATVRFCIPRPQTTMLVLHAMRGEADFALSIYSTARQTAQESPSNASREGGTCRRPLPLQAGTEIEGDTSTGRSTLRSSCGPPGAPEHVYRLHVERPSVLTATVQSDFDAVVYLQGTCGQVGTEMGCNDDAERGDTSRAQLRLALEPGDYFLVVDGYPNSDAPPAGHYTLYAQLDPMPALEEVCRNAEVLSPGQRAQGDTASQVDRFRASCAGGAASPERLYRIELDSPSRVRIRTEANYDVATHLRSICTESSSELACNDDYLRPNVSLLTARLDAGTYYMLVDGYSERNRVNQGTYTVELENTPADGDGQTEGDRCEAPSLVHDGRIRLDSFRARDDTAGSCGGEGGSDVVARLHVPRRSRVRLEFVGAQFHGVVYARKSCAAKDTEVFCEPFAPPRGGRPRPQRTVVERVLEPGEYSLFFDGRSPNDFGALDVEVTLVDLAQLARNCRRAPLLREGKWMEGDTSGGRDDLHASCAYGAQGPERVYRLRMRRPGRVRVRLESSFDAVLHVRKDCTDRSSELGCNDDFERDERTSQLDLSLERGTYYVVVDGFAPQMQGSFKVRYERLP